MNKTLVATALAAIFLAPTVSAAEIYKDDKNAVEIGGFIDARIIKLDGSDTEVVNGASRINFGFNRQMNDGWSAYTKLEWGVNPFGTSDIVYNNSSNLESKSGDFLNNRLGYVGVAHDTYGSLTIGKQWGAWYDVVYGTNEGFVWDGNAAGVYTYNRADGAVNGVGRGDKTVQYRNSFGNVSIAVQTQLKHDTFVTCGADGFVGDSEEECAVPDQGADVTFNYTYGGAVTYAVTDMLTLTAGINGGEFEIDYHDGRASSTEDDLIYGAGVMWGQFKNKGLYVAANVNKQENHDTDNIGRLIEEAYGVETLVSYQFENGLRPFISYNILDAGEDYVVGDEPNTENDVFIRQFLVVGLHYVWDANTTLYIEGRKDNSDFSNDDADEEAVMSLGEEDGVAIGIRYSL